MIFCVNILDDVYMTSCTFVYMFLLQLLSLNRLKLISAAWFARGNFNLKRQISFM
jgi:hypothetical protein